MSTIPFSLDPSSYLGGGSSDSSGFGQVSVTPDVFGNYASDGASGSSGSGFLSGLSDAFGGAFGQIAGTALGVGTNLADYGIASLGSQAAKGIGQSTGNVPPQFIPYAVPAPSSGISQTTLLILLAVAGIGAVLMLKGK